MPRVKNILSIVSNKDDKKEESKGYLKQYKVFNMTPEGPIEMDFKEWVSDINREHPIAKTYQSMHKRYFDSIRR